MLRPRSPLTGVLAGAFAPAYAAPAVPVDTSVASPAASGAAPAKGTDGSGAPTEPRRENVDQPGAAAADPSAVHSDSGAAVKDVPIAPAELAVDTAEIAAERGSDADATTRPLRQPYPTPVSRPMTAAAATPAMGRYTTAMMRVNAAESSARHAYEPPVPPDGQPIVTTADGPQAFADALAAHAGARARPDQELRTWALEQTARRQNDPLWDRLRALGIDTRVTA